MPIDPAMLVKSIGTLTDLDPTRDLPPPCSRPWRRPSSSLMPTPPGSCSPAPTGTCTGASASDQRAQTLEDNQEIFAAGPCIQAFITGKPAAMHDATMEQRWGEIALTFVEVQIRAGLSVPVELDGGPIGTLDVYAVDPRGRDQSEVSALQTYAGVVASLLWTAVKPSSPAPWPSSSRSPLTPGH
jgi:GAF domain-containing protein